MWKSKRNVCEKNSDLRKVTRKLFHPLALILCCVIILTVGFASYMDFHPECKKQIHTKINERLVEKGEEKVVFVRKVKGALIENSKEFCNLVMTFTTILAAAVTFFYSVEDNRKEGISHRTIMAYSLGSFTITILFAGALMLTVLSYIALVMQAYWLTYMSLLWGFFVGMLIIFSILLATSFQFSVHVLGNVEHRQFQAMCQLEKEKKENGNEESFTPETDRLYRWTYVPHHMEEVIKSEELMSDKIVLIRRILRAPLYKNSILLICEPNFFNTRTRALEISLERLKSNDVGTTYEFYFTNLLTVFNQLKQGEQDSRDKIYLVLYEFVIELTRRYKDSDKDRDKDRETYRENYLMIISGIMNAVLFCNTKEAVMVCKYILNSIKAVGLEDGEQIYDLLLGMYILYNEALEYIDPDESRNDNISAIGEKRSWSGNFDQEISFYNMAWENWMKYTTIRPNSKNVYFYEICERLQAYSAMVMKSKGESCDENTNDAVDQ